MPVELNANTNNPDIFIIGPFDFSINIYVQFFGTFLFCSLLEGGVWVALPQLPVSQWCFLESQN